MYKIKIFQRKQQETTRNLQKAKQSTRNQRVVNFSTQFLGSFTETFRVFENWRCQRHNLQAQFFSGANVSFSK